MGGVFLINCIQDVVCGFRVQGSAPPLAAEATSLIEEETKNEHRTLNVEHRTPNGK
jgi:hypothetical protein